MKKCFQSTIKNLAYIIFVAVSSFNVSAQITIESSNMPMVGETVTRFIDTIPAFGPGPAGGMQVWDFSMAESDDTATTQMVMPSATPYAADYPSSNLAMTNDNVSFLYFSNTISEMTTDGAAGDLLQDGNIISAPFFPILTLHEFPRVFGNSFEDEYAFEAIVDGSQFGVYEARLNHRGNVFDTTDGYGMITTPTGTYDCLRIKSTNHTTDSLWYRLFSFTPWAFLSVDEKVSVSYSWMTLETKLAVAEFSYDSIGNPAQFVFSAIPPLTTRIDKAEQSSLSIFPNPASENIRIEADKGSLVEIYSADGRTLFSETIGGNTLKVDCRSWARGIYMVRLSESDGNLVERFILE